MQSVMGNTSEQSDQMGFMDLLVRRDVGEVPVYSIPMMLLVKISLKQKNETFESGLGFGENIGSLVQLLALEPRPATIESSEPNKAFGGRFSAVGFGSRGGRNCQRGRISGGQTGISGGRRSIMRQPDDNLWDMPCSEMSSLTLGDIREVENRIKAEDLTIDQYVEMQRESTERKNSSLPQSNQKKNFVSIPISGDPHIKVNNTFSMNESHSQKPVHTTVNQQSQQKITSEHFLQRFGRKDAFQGQQALGEHQTLKLKETGPKTPLFPTANSKRTSSISEAFLKGPANLSLFDVNTPIFDDDNNDPVIEFRPPMANKFQADFDRVGHNFEQNSREHQFVQGTHNPTTSFSWSSRNSNHESFDNKPGNAFPSISTSFPALSKNSHFNHSQSTQQNGTAFPHEPNILQRLQEASISQKQGDNLRKGNLEHYRLPQNDYTNTFSRHFNQANNEYPPLSSVSDLRSSPSISSVNHSHFMPNNTVKTNDAGRLLMSIIGAGQQSSNDSLNAKGFGSGFVRHNNSFISQTNYMNNNNRNGGGNEYNNHLSNYSRY